MMQNRGMRILGLFIALSMVARVFGISPACADECHASAPAPIEIPPAPDQPVSKLEKTNKSFAGDLDAIVGRGYLRILVAPSRTHFETVDGRHHGRAVDAGVALAQRLSRRCASATSRRSSSRRARIS